MINDNKLSMYRAIHYDKKNGIVFLWFTDGRKEAYKAVHKFYTPNPGEYGSIDSGMVDIYGKPMYACITTEAKEKDIRYKHTGPDNYLCELDIDYRTRFLEMLYKDSGDLRFNMKDINVGFLDIEVESGNKFPSPKKADRRINCVTLYVSKLKKYITFGLQKYLKPETYEKLSYLNFEYRRFETERELIEDLLKTIGESDIDIMSGFNSDHYDFPYIFKRCEILGIDMRSMSRLPIRHRYVYKDKKDGTIKIAGTEMIDFLNVYKKMARSERDNNKLNTIAKEELNEEKAPLPDGYQSYKKYWDEYVTYNVTDVELLVKLEEKRRMIESVVGACAEARVPFSHFFEAKKMLVGFILSFLHKRNIVMPPLKANDKVKFPGAYVYSTIGKYKNLVSYDYRSMYPSIMMGANISPETKVTYDINEIVPEHELKNLVRSPWTYNGTKQVFYRKDKEGIIPAVVKILFDGRTDLKNEMKKAKLQGRVDDESYYDMKQNSYKILGNSLYGLLGNEYFQFYDLDNAASVTSFGYMLITQTISDLTNYFETEFKTDDRFFKFFGEYPTVDELLTGTNRLSHGDTDSFFVKYDDFFSKFSKDNGNKVDVILIKGNDLISRNTYNLNIESEEKQSKVEFNKLASKYKNDWSAISPDDKKKTFVNGAIYASDYRILYNRYTLTDFCRLLDASLMEDVLQNIMQKFSDKWNLYKNTLFLKREKCINECIVTAKKKYICNVESNEDLRFEKPKFSSTGVEIVRSSTLPFARTRIKDIVVKLLVSDDKSYIQQIYLDVKKEFYDYVREGKIYELSIPSGVKADPPDWDDMQSWPDFTRKKVDWRLRAGSLWNKFIEDDEGLNTMMLEPIAEGSKVKFIKVHKNKYGLNSIAYVGESCPTALIEKFKPNWDEQWQAGFAKVMGRLFVAVGWSKDLENDQRDLMMEVF